MVETPDILYNQGWEFAQIKWATVSDSLKKNEQPWANCSGRSRQMSDCERFTQVAHDKWATMSDSLRSRMINKRMNEQFTQKMLAKKIWNLIF